MTLNVGVRFDHFNSSVPEQFAAAGRFVPARSFAVIPDLPNWNDISPRLGVAYDLFGDSRTAIKVSVGKYAQVGSTAFASLYNPMITDADIRTWTDVNGNDIAEDSEIGRSQNNNFGVRQNRFPDPDIRRPYQMEYVVKVERQISSRVSVSGGYFRRGFHRLIHSTNRAVASAEVLRPEPARHPIRGAIQAVGRVRAPVGFPGERGSPKLSRRVPDDGVPREPRDRPELDAITGLGGFDSAR